MIPLPLSDWLAARPGRRLEALRRDADGRWVCEIADAWGVDVLGIGDDAESAALDALKDLPEEPVLQPPNKPALGPFAALCLTLSATGMMLWVLPRLFEFIERLWKR